MRWKISVILMLLTLVSFAQDKTLLINGLSVQASEYNPAIGYECWYVRLPVVSGLYADLHHSGFSYEDIFASTPEGYVIDIETMARKSADMNYISANLETNILGLGFKTKSGFWQIGLRNRENVMLGYPREYIVALQGNGQFTGNRPMNFMPFVNAQALNELSVGYSFDYRPDLRLGIRVKLLQGMASAVLNRSFARLYTDPETYDLYLTGRLRSHLSFPLSVRFDTSNIPVSAALAIRSPVKDFLINGNWGLAVDLGFIKQAREDIKIFASLNDLGFVRWRSNTLNYYGEGEFTYTGLYVSPSDFGSDPSGALSESFDSVMAQLSESYSLSYDTSAFWTTSVYLKTYAGFEKKIGKGFGYSMLMRSDFYNFMLNPSFTAGLSWVNPSGHLAVTLSASYMDRTFRNLGAAVVLQGLGMQFYAASDNLLFLANPRTTRNAGLQFGLSLMFGCKEKQKKIKSYKSGRSHRPKDLCPAYW